MRCSSASAPPPGVALASPVLEVDTYALRAGAASACALRVLGVDALRVAPLAPTLLPRAGAGARDRWPCSTRTPCSSMPRRAQRLGVTHGDTLAVQPGTAVARRCASPATCAPAARRWR